MSGGEIAEPRPESQRNRGGRTLRWVGLLVAAAGVVLAVVLASRFGSDPALVASPLIGEPAPQATLPLLRDQGTTLDFEDLRGDVVVVNFWASWCVACRAEHDALISSAQAFADRGVRFVGVVYQDDPDSARLFLDELGWGENYVYVTDPGSRTAIAFGVFGVPETFFFDREGVIVGKISGESDALLLGTTLDQILAGRRPGDFTAGTVQGQP